jgi:hypothetical protein
MAVNVAGKEGRSCSDINMTRIGGTTEFSKSGIEARTVGDRDNRFGWKVTSIGVNRTIQSIPIPRPPPHIFA